jgi:hypothetical protein
MRMTVRELREYILALYIVKNRKPLLALNGKLQLCPEIEKIEALLENALDKLPMPRRGQTKVDIEIPTDLQTTPVNEALRYGIPIAVSRGHSEKEEITLLDSCYGIAMADKLLPFSQGTNFRLLSTKEEED